MKGRNFLVLFLCFLMGSAVSQSLPTDVLTAVEEEAAREGGTPDLENVDQESSLGELLRELVDLNLQPLDLNTASRDDLERLPILSDLQGFNLIAYRETYGPLVTVFELQVIDGFDRRTIVHILPYIKIGQAAPQYEFTFRHLTAYGKHQLLLRMVRVLEQRTGYKHPADSMVTSSPGKHYLGSPERIFFRYGFNFRNRVRFGFTVEKDPGETFPLSQVSDSLKENLPAKGFDFFSFHLSLSQFGVLKSFVAGDYQLQFGQGLTFGSGQGFGGGGDFSRVRRVREGIKPHTGPEENRFLRGVAATLQKNHLQATLFYSGHRADARLVPDTTSGNPEYTAYPDYSGQHRTLSELGKKNTLSIRTGGVRVSYRNQSWRVGVTAVRTEFQYPVGSNPGLYGAFLLSGREHFNAGLDYHFMVGGISFFGEAATGGNGSVAQLHGLEASLHPGLAISLVFRDYQRNYQNPFTNAFAVSNTCNERGIYLGMRILLPQHLLLHGYLDVYQFPWLRYRADRPGHGKDMVVALENKPEGNVSVVLRLKYREYQVNYTAMAGYLTPLQEIRRISYRIQAGYVLSPSVSMRNRIEFVRNRQEGENVFFGFLIYHDIRWKNKTEKVLVDFRYALFDTDTYNERIYAYEPDVLYAFSVPGYYYRGTKAILLAKVKVSGVVSFGFRIARTSYFDRSVIGSGADEISGSSITEVKLQLLIKPGKKFNLKME